MGDRPMLAGLLYVVLGPEGTWNGDWVTSAESCTAEVGGGEEAETYLGGSLQAAIASTCQCSTQKIPFIHYTHTWEPKRSLALLSGDAPPIYRRSKLVGWWQAKFLARWVIQ